VKYSPQSLHIALAVSDLVPPVHAVFALTYYLLFKVISDSFL